MDATIARAMWQLLEPYHTITYFVPEVRAASDALGLVGGWMSYFGTRAAPLGPVPAEIVIATFYNFHPSLVRRAIPDAWRRASPPAILAARLDAVDAALRRLLGDMIGSTDLEEAASLAREAAEGCEAAGRPLFAAYAALDWPESPHLVLWTAATRLREHRFDGHVASLLTAHVDPCEAHVTITAAGVVTAETQRRVRAWSEEEWQAAVDRLRARGWLHPDGSFTDEGRAGRAAVERSTDELALGPWERLGMERSRRLWDLMRPVSGRVMDGGGIPTPNPMGLPWPPTVPFPAAEPSS